MNAAPRILVADARAAYLGPGLKLTAHRNAVATIALGLEHAFTLTLFDEGAPAARETRMAVIAPGALHHLETRGAMAFLYLDALSDAYARLDPRPEAAADILGMGPAVTIAEVWSAVGIPHRAPLDDAMARTVRALDADPCAFASVHDGARLAGLSASRFQHAFRAATGAPFRRYRLWRRMAVVTRMLASGKNLTTAAHEAGFSSSAHLSATFRAMFGVSPSALRAAGARFEASAA
ncbi:MAG: AraC family transcriptional regulator [Hyphomonadaceae bacterium]|nr:AraC family transcriptional regulator [Hyphomonadaceae bacterium]